MTPRSDIGLDGRSSRKRETGQTIAEYAVVLTVITISVVVVFAIFSGGVAGAINRVVGLIP